MTRSDPTVTAIDLVDLPTRYPRTVGRNARLGSHGSGGTSTVAILRTDSVHVGWGLVERVVAGEWTETVIGRPLSELIDPDSGVRDDAYGFLDVPLHDLLGQVLDLPVHAILGGQRRDHGRGVRRGDLLRRSRSGRESAGDRRPAGRVPLRRGAGLPRLQAQDRPGTPLAGSGRG